jgi:hypothetical protein
MNSEMGMQKFLCAPTASDRCTSSIHNSGLPQPLIPSPHPPFPDGLRTSHTLLLRRVLVTRACFVAVAFERQIDEAVKQL